MVCLIYADEFLDHDTGAGHPESPQRLRGVVEHLRGEERFRDLEWRSPSPPEISKTSPLMQAVFRAHTPNHVALVQSLAAAGGGALDADTPVSPRSYGVALLAVQAWLEGLDYALQAGTSAGNSAFILARPPGHHACRDHGMGFCLFSNGAIAALEALTRPGINRVAIVDWDVHHGNGTQDIVEEVGEIAYCSVHQSPAYPGTGNPLNQASKDYELANHVLNCPVPPGTDFASYRTQWDAQVLPFLRDFAPDLIVVSAGYDATAMDPLAGVDLEPENYQWLTESLLTFRCPLVLGLEGGYHVQTLAHCVDYTLRSLLSAS